MKFSTRHALSDKALVELAEQRGREVLRLQLMLGVVERERDEALARLRLLEAGRAGAVPAVKQLPKAAE
jgi:hypothetical protein